MCWEFSVSAQVYCQKDRGERETEADRQTQETGEAQGAHTHARAHRETHFYKNQSQRYPRKVLVVIGWTAGQW